MSFLVALLSLYTIARAQFGGDSDCNSPADISWYFIFSKIGNPPLNVWCITMIEWQIWYDKEGFSIWAPSNGPYQSFYAEKETDPQILLQVELSPGVTTTNTCYDTNPTDTADITAVAAQNFRANCPLVNPNDVKAVYYPGSNDILLLCFRVISNPVEWECFKITKRVDP